MDKEGYDRAFTAALIASASTMANLIPPSIMAVVYGATGNVSIGGLFLAGVVPGVLIGIGLMVYSYFWGPVGVMKKRAPFTEVVGRRARRGAAAGHPGDHHGRHPDRLVHADRGGDGRRVYILVVLIPVLRPTHVRELPRDFMYAGLLYSLPLAAVAGASAFGWMVAYLRGPDIVAGYITAIRRHRPRDDHVPAGRAVRDRRRLHRRGAGDHHLHADHHQADRGRPTSIRCTWAW